MIPFHDRSARARGATCMRVSNRVRFAIWFLLLLTDVVLGKWIDHLLNLSCSWTLCVIAGSAIFVLIVRAAMVTGRYLAVYGNTRGKFGDIKRLVREGPYGCMRHPMHLFLSMTPIAVGLVSGSLGGALIVGPVLTLLILYMAVTIDERESLERFGEEYLEYRRSVPAFNLTPDCLKLALFQRPKREECD